MTTAAKGVIVRGERLYQLDVGAGNTTTKGYATIDVNIKADFNFDLETCQLQQLPFEDDTFTSIRCSHVLEHIHNLLPLMQELHRVTIPGGQMLIRVPYGSSDNADEDPTHVRRFFTDSCGYFSQAAYGNADYGYRGDWSVQDRVLRLRADPMVFEYAQHNDMPGLLRLVYSFRNLVDEMLFILQCVKPARTPGSFKESAPINFVLPKDGEEQDQPAIVVTH